ncbi:MAG TPA: transketolase C-terminal domain-containing protein [Terriglobales bacterium]
MRTAFIKELCELAEVDERIWLICGDLGYSVLEAFSDRFPKRYLNAGVAEQNMTGIAAGLALTGKIVFTYSIANFPVMRCLEQVRNDVCYHNLNVKIVSVGGGLAYGSHGYTHHGVEDLAVMSVLPNMTVIAPGDPIEARAATRAVIARPGPAYLQLGKAGEPVLHRTEINFQIGRAIQVEDGDELTLISTGGMLGETLHAAATLRNQGHSIRVLSMPTLVPFDVEAVRRASRETGGIITVEEHGLGGLGTRTAEVLAESASATPFFPVRLASVAIKTAGSQTQLRGSQGVCADGVVARAEQMLGQPAAGARPSGR